MNKFLNTSPSPFLYLPPLSASKNAVNNGNTLDIESGPTLSDRCPDRFAKKTSNNKVLLLRENSEFGKNTFESFFSFPNFKLEKSESHRRRQNFGAEEKSFSSTKFLNSFKPPGCQVCLWDPPGSDRWQLLGAIKPYFIGWVTITLLVTSCSLVLNPRACFCLQHYLSNCTLDCQIRAAKFAFVILTRSYFIG